MPIETVDARQVDAAVGPSDQGHGYKQLSYAQDTIESIQNMRLGCISKSLQSRSPSAEIKGGNPSNSVTDYSEFARTLAFQEKSDHHQELDQQSLRSIEEPSSFKDVDPSAELQPSYSWGDLNPQDYFVQDDKEWRAQQPSGDFEEEFPDSQDGSLQRSGPIEAEFSDFDSFINCSSPSTPSIASTSPSLSQGRDMPLQTLNLSTHCSTLATKPDIKSPALVNTWQIEGMINGIMPQTAYDQNTGTLDPRDLL